MSWIFRFIPFPFLIFAAGLAAAAATVALAHFETQKKAAREAGVPRAISASEIGEVRSFPWFDEVAVQVQLNDDLSYVYWESSADGEIQYPILFFVDPSKSGPVREVLGAIAFDSYEADDMINYLESVQLEDGALGSVHELVGVPTFLPYVTYEEVTFAAEDLGLTMAENFLYLDPHFEGRDARVAARPELMYFTAGAAVLLVWLSMVAAIIRRRWRRAREADSLRKVAKKGLMAAAVGGAKMLVSDDEEADFI